MMTVEETREFLRTEYGINSYEELCRAIEEMGKINIAPFATKPRRSDSADKGRKKRAKKS